MRRLATVLGASLILTVWPIGPVGSQSAGPMICALSLAASVFPGRSLSNRSFSKQDHSYTGCTREAWDASRIMRSFP